MLVALTSKGQVISLVMPLYTPEFLHSLRKLTEFYCPVCKQKVILKLGQKKIWHFAHHYHFPCTLTQYEAESERHLKGKKELFTWFETYHQAPILEHYLPELHQRPDLYLPQKRVAIEYQCSNMPLEVIKRRIRGYHQEKLANVWILGENRLKRKGLKTKLSQMDLMMMHDQSIFRNLNQSPFVSPYKLLFFNPSSKIFTYIHHIIPLTPTQFISERKDIKMSHINPNHLFTMPLSHSPKPLANEWNKHKQRERLIPHKYTSQTEHYLRTLCYKKNRVYYQFPSFIGLPHYSYIRLETSPVHWQYWIFLRYINNAKPYARLSIKRMIKEIKYYIQKGILRERKNIFAPSLEFAIKIYLNQLCYLRVLYKIDKDFFIHPDWLNYDGSSIETLIQKDHEILHKLHTIYKHK
ncbi:competence protein CoiA [Terrilactibacillus laevilacticus]|uniref:Competence protein CoiA n=1 Tax=Terrilactibacillus laevilacticus TaxID=1380157 RepID=A0ABW5PQG6_9BACI|nr:competence protein CoiA family protein [Terrilactibacillus laevilacticus]